jgi:ABC-type nitrate/sulfonate/bicarbonate transport system substrate-binding protein
LLANLGWEDKEQIRLPSGDGAILSFVGGGADAASMVEPYATMLEQLGMGTVIRRTGDIWPKAPGCSLTTTTQLTAEQPELVEAVVRAFVRGHQFVREAPDASAACAARYIGVDAQVIRAALRCNRPDLNALRNHQAMEQVLTLMIDMGYLDHMPAGYSDLRFLDRVAACCPAHARGAA